MSILVRNIDNSVSKEDLRKIFKDCGEIRKIDLIKNKREIESEIFFSNKQALKKAEEKNNFFFKNNFLSVTITEDKKNFRKFNKNFIEEEEESKESEVSDKEYLNFITEYKQFLKGRSKTSFKAKKITSENDVSTMLTDAMNLYLSSKYDEAINYLHEIIRLSPELPEPYHHLSLIYEKKGELHKALDFLMLSAQLSHGESEIWIRCSYLNRKLNYIQQAEYCISRALKIERDNPYLLYERAVLQEEMGNIKKAANIYERILKIIPNNSDILIYVSNLYLKLKNNESAIDILEKYFEKSNKKYIVLVVLFNLYLSNNKYKEGIEFYEKMFLKSNDEENIIPPIDLKLRYMFFKLLLNESKMDSFGTKQLLQLICEEIEKLDINQHVDVVNKLYDILEKLNQFDKFYVIFEKLDDVDESGNINPEIFVKIADLYRNNNIEKSIHFYLKAVKYFPKDISIRLKLSELFKENSQFNKALEILVIKPEDEERDLQSVHVDNNLNIIIDKSVIKENPYNQNNFNSKIDEFENEKVKSSDSKNFLFDYEENENLLSENNFTQEYLNIRIDEENLPQLNTLENNTYNGIEENLYSNRENLSMIINKATSESLIDPVQYIDLYENRFLKENSNKTSRKTSTSFLKKKRIKRSHCNYENYNFENYLFRRNSKVLSKDAYSITSIRLEFDEIHNSISKIKNTYIKLQESLIYLESNNIEKFIENTFTPLKNALLTELKIEELKNRVFENLLSKSHIKNYFKRKSNILEDMDNYPNIIDLNDQNENRENSENGVLFLRKSNSNNILNRKKVRKSMEFAENQIKKIDILFIFFSEKNFFSIIYHFIKYAYTAEKYNQSYHIIKLILNSEKIRNNLNALNFNIYIYAVLNNIKLNNYKIAFYYLKKLIISNNLKNSNVYWVYLWDLAKNLNYSFLRSYLYKLKLNKSLKGNSNLDVFLGNCYLQTGNYDLAEKSLTSSDELNHPLINLQICLGHLYKSLSRNNRFKRESLIMSNEYLNSYCTQRKNENINEIIYNTGRFYQFIGYDLKAFENYNKLITILYNLKEDDVMKKIKTSTLYNYALLYKKSGNDVEAHNLILENIII